MDDGRLVRQRAVDRTVAGRHVHLIGLVGDLADLPLDVLGQMEVVEGDGPVAIVVAAGLIDRAPDPETDFPDRAFGFAAEDHLLLALCNGRGPDGQRRHRQSREQTRKSQDPSHAFPLSSKDADTVIRPAAAGGLGSVPHPRTARLREP